MTLSEMRQLLAAHDIQLTRSLGQCFLHDGNQLRRIVAQADLGPTDRVLEIGPGLGPLTDLLATAASRVVAIEKDARLVALLAERSTGRPNLEIVHDDALDRLRANPAAWDDWKLVANLPYSVASPILVELALAAQVPERCVVTVQLEVAQRLVAPPGGKDYGVLSLLVQQRYEPAGWFRIPATCFFPAPEVDSACITLKRRPTQWLNDAERMVFARIVRRAFSERRKMMFKLLKHDWPEPTLRAALDSEQIPLDTRAERVAIDRFVALARRLHAAAPEEIFDVVDDLDVPIGRAPRSEVHRRGLKHRAVHVLVFNSRGEVFLQKRSKLKDCFPGTWDSSASGHLAPDEPYDTCAVREVQEELGWTPAQTPERLFRLEACAETGQEFLWVYWTPGEGPFRLHPEEIETGGWFTPATVSSWIATRPRDFAGAMPLIWRRLLQTGSLDRLPTLPPPSA